MARTSADIIVTKNIKKHVFSLMTSMLVSDKFTGKKFTPSMVIKVKTEIGLAFVNKYLKTCKMELDTEYPLSQVNKEVLDNSNPSDVTISYVSFK